MVRVVDRDVLEHRRFAKAEEKAQHEQRSNKGPLVHLRRKGDRAILALDHIARRRIGQHEQQDQREAESPVHHRPRAEPVAEVATIGAKQAGRQAEGRSRHAGGFHVHAIDADQVMRHPQGKGHKPAEHKEVVQRKAPDLQVGQRGELLGQCGCPAPGFAARHQFGVILGKDKEDHREHGQTNRPGIRHPVPAVCDHHKGGDKLGHRSADVARAEDPQRGALLARRIPARHIGDADDERSACQTHAKRCDEIHRIGMGKGQQPSRECGQQHLQRKHDAPAEFLGPDPQKQPRQRAGQDWRGDQQAEFKLVQPQFSLDRHADDGKDRPHCEAGGKGHGAK